MSYLALDRTTPTVAILLDASGNNLVRWTLQAPTREGRVLTWTPEGTLRQLRGEGWPRRWVHRGWRRSLALTWDVGLLSLRETWSGEAWTDATEAPTAQAVSEILEAASTGAVQVEPIQDSALGTWLANGLEHPLVLQDLKGVAHTALMLTLQSVGLVDQIELPHGYGLMSFGIYAYGG